MSEFGNELSSLSQALSSHVVKDKLISKICLRAQVYDVNTGQNMSQVQIVCSTGNSIHVHEELSSLGCAVFPPCFKLDQGT